MFEDIDGTTPRTPWQAAELDRVLRAIEELSAGLTPAPSGVEPVGELMPDVFTGWQRLAAGVESGQDDLRGVNPWAQRHLGALVALEGASKDAASGDRKSTRLNSSHLVISYAVFCLKKKKRTNPNQYTTRIYIQYKNLI